MEDKFERGLLVLGQVGGWTAGAATYFNLVKDVFGFIGILCGTVLSAWAVADRLRRWHSRRQRAKRLLAKRGSTPPFSVY